jgi:hypothetical protein
MSVTSQILATYRNPRRVMRGMLAAGRREDRALAILVAGCVLAFVAQWPRLARDAYVQDAELDVLLGGALMAWIFIAPLLLYVLAALSRLAAAALRGQGTHYSARLALFWSWLAAAPVLLLHGLTAGFVGPGPALDLIGLIWFGLFGWFWLSCLTVSERGLEDTGTQA